MYCCLINGLYALLFGGFYVNNEIMKDGSRLAGLDQNPVPFGYNMLLGFWLSMIRLKKKDFNKFYLKLDFYYQIIFLFGIFSSGSRGAVFGLLAGITFVFLSKKNKIKTIIYTLIFSIFLYFLFLYNPVFFYKNLNLQRFLDMFVENSTQERFYLWSEMTEVYFENFNPLIFLFGGGAGFGNDLIGRGVHSDHFKLLFDFGLIGYLIYLIKILTCFKLTREFNEFLGGFLVSTLASGIFYVNIGSITNSFSYYLVLIVLFNFINSNDRKLYQD